MSAAVLQSLELGALEKYNPPAVESSWYAWWEQQGFFKPQFTEDGKIKSEGMFVITLPPPNITGKLHIGHALTGAIQDTIARWFDPLLVFIDIVGIGCWVRLCCTFLVSIMQESRLNLSSRNVLPKIEV